MRRLTRGLTVALITFLVGFGATRLVTRLKVSDTSQIPEIKHSPQPDNPYVLLEGRTIRLMPYNATFDIPEFWIDDKDAHNIHLIPKQLDRVYVGDGEWDKEYARVINAALPFENCVAHIGYEGLDEDGYLWSDWQARVYVVDSNLEDVFKRITKSGYKEAWKISKGASASWSNGGHGLGSADIDFPLFYHGYIGSAHIYFRVQALGDKTAAVVLMQGWK